MAYAQSYQNGVMALVSVANGLATVGEPVAPRGLPTRELCDVTLLIDDPRDVTLYGCNRVGYRPAIGAVEGLLLLAGVSDPALLRDTAAVFSSFQDGGALHGAYGPRLRQQLPFVLGRLQADPATRQAVCTIWNPAYDLQDTETHTPPRDLPCTVALTFRIRDGKLTLKVHMRSNDAWLGLPYDLIQFTLLQCTVANVLRLPVGAYVHHVDSLHVYERDLEKLLAVEVGSNDDGVRPRLDGLHGGFLTQDLPDSRPLAPRWERDVRQLALRLLYHEVSPASPSSTEMWLRARVDGVRLAAGRNQEG